MTASASYDPQTFRALTFHDAAARFRDGAETPRAYLERCLETIAAREPVVKAFAARNAPAAREEADSSTTRWRAGRPLSPIDGMPIGIKDLLETKDMPTQMGCKAFRDNFPRRDNAAVWALRQAGAVICGKTVTAELGGLSSAPPPSAPTMRSSRHRAASTGANARPPA
jgi:Asp-tRNA(Asn)/Glu-tRNA(Gln) amidotransferase A subunit family amidase